MINIGILTFLWIVAAFNYLLINFQLKYIEGDIYRNAITSSVSEIFAYIISGTLYKRLGAKASFIGAFAIAIIGSLLLITIGDIYPDLIPGMILGSKFGISGAFIVLYLANTLFPPTFSSTTFGVFNFSARLASMVAPNYAELQAPIPMATFCGLAGCGAIVSIFIRTNNQ